MKNSICASFILHFFCFIVNSTMHLTESSKITLFLTNASNGRLQVLARLSQSIDLAEWRVYNMSTFPWIGVMLRLFIRSVNFFLLLLLADVNRRRFDRGRGCFGRCGFRRRCEGPPSFFLRRLLRRRFFRLRGGGGGWAGTLRQPFDRQYRCENYRET